jgi:outer membrane protein
MKPYALRRNLLTVALLAASATASAGYPGPFTQVPKDRTSFVQPASFRDEPIAVADLMQCYELARQSDPILAGAEANSLAIGEGVAQARSLLMPLITATYDWQDSDSEGSQQRFVGTGLQSFEFSGDTRDKNWGAQLQQRIFNFADWSRVTASKYTADAGRLDYDAALDGLLQRVANVYFGVLRAKDNLSFAMADETALKRQLEQAEQRFEVGLSAITDVEEARARYDAARATTITARNVFDDAKVALAEVTGSRIDEVKPLREDLPLIPPEPNAPEAWLDLAQQNSPVILSDENTVRAADYSVRAAYSGHLPTLDGFVNYLDGETTGENTFNGVTNPADSTIDNTVIGLRVTIPIFSGGLTQSQVRQAIYNRDAARDLLEQDRRSVLRSTVNSYRNTVAGISSVDARRQALRSAQAALEATQAGFEVGTRTIVDVLIAQQALTQAYSLYAGARYDFVLNRLAMEAFAGTIEVADLQEVNGLLDDEVPTVEEMSTRAVPKTTPIDEVEPDGGN